MDAKDRLSLLPSVDSLLKEAEMAGWTRAWRRPLLLRFLRRSVDEVREAVRQGSCAEADREALARLVLEKVRGRLARLKYPGIRKVVNATGVMIHTNLGRSPLGAGALHRAAACLDGYANLEFDLRSGARGRRDTPIAEILRDLLGAGDATAVNNNAAALYLALSALAAGGEVIVSRGELVEIGGSFRIPDIMAASGAQLREVGTTNRTRLADYAEAITPQTRLLLQVHRSNFAMVGFVESPTPEALAALSRERGVPLLVDAGSGLLFPPEARPPALAGTPAPTAAGEGFPALPAEPVVAELLDAGVDLVCFSGDKLLGGPQAGVLVGRSDLVATMRKHPLMRVLRLDKVALFLLADTLQAYAGVAVDVPLRSMASVSAASLKRRCRGFVKSLKRDLGGLGALNVTVEGTEAVLGGGSTPGLFLASAGVVLALGEREAGQLEAHLRDWDPPIVARVDQGRVIFDFRTLTRRDETCLRAALVKHFAP